MKIIESIYCEPQKWRVSWHTFRHEDGLEVWIGNGLLFYNTFPESAWPFWMKLKFWKAFRWWSVNRPVSVKKEEAA